MKTINRLKIAATLVVILLATIGVFAQTGYKLGDKVASFSLKDAGGKEVSLGDFNSGKALVVVFTNTTCPYAKLYENRLVNLAGIYAGKSVQFVFINPSIGGEGGETLEDMAAKKYSFPYLVDEGQKISAQFGATKTPEAFVLYNSGNGFVLKYKGAIDDNPQVETSVKNSYLKTVIDEVLANKTVTVLDKRPTGCMIKRY